MDKTRAYPRQRQNVLKLNGWGYADSKFILTEDGVAKFTGTRYEALGEEILPKLRKWFEDECGADIELASPPKTIIRDSDYPLIAYNDEFVKALTKIPVVHSKDVTDRVVHGHGHTLEEIFKLRHAKLDRIPDLVVWPGCHEHVERIVDLASKHDVCIIPFGGGTSVSLAVQCPNDEKRMIVSLDTTEMNQILWIDPESRLAHIQAGIIGQDLERKLSEHGFCSGHEPDSMEFSSLGGWVATRASGMKKNIYGNIEDLVISLRAVTPNGTIERNCNVPRISAGPDVQQFILGSEGMLGVVTEVTIKIKPQPEFKAYDSLVFPSFESGVKCLHEVAMKKIQPASIRLMDNDQFRFGQALKPGSTTFWTHVIDQIKAFYLLKFKQFKAEKLCVCTLLFEGRKDDVDRHKQEIIKIAKGYGGLPAGAANGERGYMLTYVIAYLRDLGLDYYFIAESFETSVPWHRVADLCVNVKALLHRKCREFGITRKPLITCRVTQTYDTGACVYFYYGFQYYGINNPLHVYEEVENAAREEVLANGGSISHHHGIGKIRQKWLKETVSPVGVGMLEAIKKKIDPNNIFAVKNML